MSLQPRDVKQVPELTAYIARSAFPNGHPYITLRDTLGPLYEDAAFASLFSETRGRPAESPGCLTLVAALQYAEGLSDREAANAVRGRIEWKYLLGLEMTDAGFHYSVLSDFRKRIVEHEAQRLLLEELVKCLKEAGLIKKRGRQRSDSTHVLAAIWEMNRLENVGETLRHVLNCLSVVAPEWVKAQVPGEWFERYGRRLEQWRLPKTEAKRDALFETIGQDGFHLLQALDAPAAPAWLREIPAVETLCQIWRQQYELQDGHMRKRKDEDLPPAEQLIVSPYDTEARFSVKRDTEWCGYKVHLTETCDADQPHVITNVETTPSTTPDVSVTEAIHQHLAEQDTLPGEHLVDAGYVDAQLLADSEQEHSIDLIGPAPRDTSWQALAGQGFDLASFSIDWEQEQATCPQGVQSACWFTRQDQYGTPVVYVKFPKKICQSCPARKQCTRSKAEPRTLKLRPEAHYQALHKARKRQKSEQFKQQYAARAGVEGSISQGTRSFGLRRSRYVGLAKTHLQHVLTAIAIDMARLADWFEGTEIASTRCSAFAALAPS
jgi:transposase